VARGVNAQESLFPEIAARFPSTRYQGSKAKIVDWIWEQVADLRFASCLDAFGGTGAVAYRLKQAGKQVTYNDLLHFNYYTGVALIENSSTRLDPEETEWLLQRHPGTSYPDFVERTFHDIYFTDEENAWIDQTITNIRTLEDPYKHALAFFALCQSCIIKRPYNLFHRRNLYLRLAEVDRSFGNKATWDRPFPEWFRAFANEANQAVFDNGAANHALNLDAIEVPGDYDLVYIDPPYISGNGVGVDYHSFYHFLEGLAMYEEWEEQIDRGSRHLRLRPRPSAWTDKDRITGAFDRLFARFGASALVVSYRSDGIPSLDTLVSLARRYRSRVRVEHFGRYKYVLSTNPLSGEALIVAE